MKLVRRVLVQIDDNEKWVNLEECTSGMKRKEVQLHFIPEEGCIFQANESDEEREYLVFKEDNEREWHEKLKEGYVSEH